MNNAMQRSGLDSPDERRVPDKREVDSVKLDGVNLVRVTTERR